MVEIGKKYNLDDKELQDLFVLGLIHDIGYEFGNNSNHGQIGGEILKRNKYKYWKEIYYHGVNASEYSSLFLKILNKADVQIDYMGKTVGYTRKLEDIKNRYGENSITYRNAEILIAKIKND